MKTTLIYHSSALHKLLMQSDVSFKKQYSELKEASKEDCLGVDQNTGVVLANDLLYPEHLDLPIQAVIEIQSRLICLFGTIPPKLKALDIRSKLGKVYLVGAGQNSREHLTLKANQILQQAEIIFYDSLIDKRILDDLSAELVFVGKRAGEHYKKQSDINNLLLDATYKYKYVVRIKGGDPMVFGHAGEEIAYLEQKFINVEVIPGISSALGGAAISHTPLTLRNVSNSVAFCTAHQKSQVPVPNTDTIVYFMGAGNMKNVAKQLLKSGKDENTPIKLIYNIGGNDEAVFTETIASILAGQKTYKAPLLSIIGEVADKSNWHKAFEQKPKILFTGTNITKYIHLGYVIHHPMIDLVELDDFSEVDTSIKQINNYNYLLFTSAYAVKYFFKRLYQLGKDSRALTDVRIASIGRFTSGKLKEHGIIPDLQATEESSEGLIALFGEKGITNHSIVIPRSDLAHNTLPEGLKKLGNKVNALAVYRNVKPKIDKMIEPESYDQLIFTSPSGVKNFVDIYGKLPETLQLIAKGKETQKEIDYFRSKK